MQVASEVLAGVSHVPAQRTGGEEALRMGRGRPRKEVASPSDFAPQVGRTSETEPQPEEGWPLLLGSEEQDGVRKHKEKTDFH